MAVTPEGLVFDGLDLNPASGIYALEEFDPGIAKKRPEWVQGADSDGAALVRDPLFDTATMTAKVRIVAASMDAALAAVGAIVDKLEEAERQQDGLGLTWTPATGSKSGTGYVLSGEITDLPINPTDGWFISHPVLTIAMTRKPFWYASEVTGPSATGTAPVLTLAVPNVGGDVPAEARLVVTEGSAKSRRYVEWGLEQRFYNAGSPSSLLLDSEDLVTSGFAGAQASRSGAYRRAGATHDTVSAALFSQPVAVCGTGNQPHVGTFRVKARVYCSSTTVRARLRWQDGDGPLSANDYISLPVSGAFAEIDLGLITIEPARAGGQRWTGIIDAFSPTIGDTIEIDYLLLIPAEEGYGRARASYAYAPGSIFAHDEFVGSAAALNGRAAPAGGSWATSGASTDLTSDGAGNEQRATTSDSGRGRLAILGSTVSTDVEVSILASVGQVGVIPSGTLVLASQGALARYVDANNYLHAHVTPPGPSITNLFGGPTAATLAVEQIIGGTVTSLGSAPVANTNAWRIVLIAYSSGHVVALAQDLDGTSLGIVEALSAAALTGGALANGKSGFFDYNADISVFTRSYTDFRIATPAPEPIVLYAGRTLEVRSEDTIRQDSAGTFYGRPRSYRGSRLFLPPAGDQGRTSRIVVKAARSDLEVAEHTPLGDSLSAQIFYTPRSLVVPR